MTTIIVKTQADIDKLPDRVEVMEKPREFWIMPHTERHMGVYEGKHFNATDMKLNPGDVHVIEKSAYDELVRENEHLKRWRKNEDEARAGLRSRHKCFHPDTFLYMDETGTPSCWECDWFAMKDERDELVRAESERVRMLNKTVASLVRQLEREIRVVKHAGHNPYWSEKILHFAKRRMARLARMPLAVVSRSCSQNDTTESK